MTIAQLLTISYPEILKYKLGNHDWLNKRLQCKTKRGKIRLQSLGATIEVYHGTNIPPTRYEVSEVSTPLLWTNTNELETSTEHKKITFVANLIINGLRVHDNMILDLIGNNRAVVSKEYRYHLGEVVGLRGNYMAKIYTALVVTD